MDRILELTERFYGIEPRKLRADWLDSNYKRKELEKFYAPLGRSQEDKAILDVLCIITRLLDEDGPLGRTSIENAMTEKLIRREILKLLVFSRENRKSATITVNSTIGKITFANYGNWLYDRLLEPFFKREELNVISTANARAMLNKTKKKAGRTPPDPRTQPLLLGTYEFISELRDFPSPMPNSLCEFLLNLLTFWGVLPENPIIDTMWIRAQLRYLKKKHERPLMPIGNLV